jgi:hypothetical protein
MKKLSLLMPLALALAGCGDSTTIGPIPPMPPGPQAAPDAFYTRVLAVVITGEEDSEAPAIDAIVATTPEDGEPVAL